MLQSSNSNDKDSLLKKEQLQSYCRVSYLAGTDSPETNKNYRNNPSLLLQLENKNVIIDVGKTFREGALRWFPRYSVASLDAIVLTHHHMDAAAGLDDVRGFQERSKPMPLFVAQACLNDLQERFPWLLPKQQEQEVTAKVFRWVASFNVTVFEAFRPVLVLPGLVITPLPVMHGEDLVSYGFHFVIGTKSVVYLSDISRMIPETMEYIQTKLPPTDVLIVDALHVDAVNSVHFSMEQAIDLAKQIRPKQTYFVGMNCDSFLPHDEMNDMLKRVHGNFALAHDGLVIEG
jgi:phosphoribosyl 1,2-cyclic phosphodiesterase